MRDILRQPAALAGALDFSLGPGRGALEEAARLVRQASHLYITGMGSSFHAAMALAAMCTTRGRPVTLVDSSELARPDTRFAGSAAMIVLSRSGRSAEVVRVADRAARAGVQVIAVTNEPASPLATQARVTLRVEGAQDHAVSACMYTAVALVGGLLVRAAGEGVEAAWAEGLRRSIIEAESFMDPWKERLESSTWLSAERTAYFLARGTSVASSHETKLLWEEAVKLPASALTTGEFRHGHQEMIEPGLPVALWIQPDWMRKEDLGMAAEIRALGGRVLLIGQNLEDGAGDTVMTLPAIEPEWQFLIDVLPAQLAAEALSRRRGVDCDTFRYCAYVVESDAGLVQRERPR